MFKDLKMDEYYVAYLDLLGSKKKIEQDDENNTDIWLKALDSIYKETFKAISVFDNAIRDIEPKVSKLPPENMGSMMDFIRRYKEYPVETKIFSDNVIIAIKVPTEDSDKRLYIHRLYSIVSHFQMYSLCKYQWMLRGGITCGKLHIEKDYFIWGKALIDAHALEDEKNKPPRIRVDDKFAQIHKDLFLDNYREYNFADSPLIHDEEGIYFVGYENLIHDQYNYFKKDGEVWLNYFREALSEMLTEHESDESIMEKVRWAIDYHNTVCSQVNANHLKVEI